MSYRTYVNDVQVFGNNEYYPEWIEFIKTQGIDVNENGNYENFILKCQERLCTAAQLEIMRQTRDTLLKYRDALKESESPLYDDIEKYTHGARCTFPNYKCSKPCGFKEGITLTRKI